MLKKLTKLAPVLLITVSITGCSGTKGQSNVSLQTPKSSTVKTISKEKIKVSPVVFKKNTPAKHVQKPRYVQPKLQNRVQKPRFVQPRNNTNSFAAKLSNAAMERLRHKVRYDGKYIKIAYPWGDVPANIGVCTDVVIRSYRRLGIDLQQKVHEDMSQGGFFDYPNLAKWNLRKPDKNIDHRRVYNLQAFFRRHGASLPVTRNPNNYKPGDLVTWMVNPEFPHIGVVVEERSKADPRRHMIVHNIGRGTEIEDILFSFPVTGHYRYTNTNKLVAPRHFNNNYALNKNQQLNEDMIQLIKELNL